MRWLGLSTALFAVYPDAQGSLTTNSTDPSTLNTKNPFFDPKIGINGQACVTCHEPFTGITITVPFINQTFAASGGTDPLFRFNNTANNPSFGSPTAANYSVFLKLGTARTAKTVPATKDFTVVADAATNMKFAAGDTPTNNVFPLMNDPQHPRTPTLSLFRRPLINTNMNFDSAVLWDGRERISNMPSQASHAIQTMLLGAGTDPAVNQSLADFMTGVYTDQKASNVGGELTRNGATGGVGNLVALSQSPSRPCVSDPAGVLTQFVAEVQQPPSPLQLRVRRWWSGANSREDRRRSHCSMHGKTSPTCRAKEADCPSHAVRRCSTPPSTKTVLSVASSATPFPISATMLRRERMALRVSEPIR
jgi:hypothetical protein